LHPRFCGFPQHNAAAASIGRVWRALDESVSLHAGEHLRHRLLDLGEAGQITLRVGSAVAPKSLGVLAAVDHEARISHQRAS